MDKKSVVVDEQAHHSRGLKLFKVLVTIFIPLLFFLMLVVLFLKLAGLNPVQVAQSIIPGQHTQTIKPVGGTAGEIKQLNQTISDQKQTIQQLQSDSNKKNDQLAQLQNQLKQAQQQANQQASAKKSADKAAKMQVYAQTYRNMDPTKAAAIFDKLPIKQAATYINMLDDKTKASILENMTADKAAQLTTLLQASSSAASSSSSSGSVSSLP